MDDEGKEHDVEFCFTDGSGNISPALCDEIDYTYGIKGCSAYQIRIGGCKGVLLKKLELKEKEPGKKIIEVRPSMIKFKSDDLGLEIIRCATFSQGYLNRQVIMLLECLGVEDDVFLTLLNKAMEKLEVTKIIMHLVKRCQEMFKKNAKRKEDRATMQELAKELDIFFGPSRVFSLIFRQAILFHAKIDMSPNLHSKEKFRVDKEPIFL